MCLVQKSCYGHMQFFTRTPFSYERSFASEVVLEDRYFYCPVSTYRVLQNYKYPLSIKSKLWTCKSKALVGGVGGEAPQTLIRVFGNSRRFSLQPFASLTLIHIIFGMNQAPCMFLTLCINKRDFACYCVLLDMITMTNGNHGFPWKYLFNIKGLCRCFWSLIWLISCDMHQLSIGAENFCRIQI